MNILIALDGSSCSELAVEFVAQRLYKPEDKFLLLSVVEPIPGDLGFGDKALAEKEHEKRMAPLLESLTEINQRAKEKISSAHSANEIEARITTGTVVETIIEAARQFKADLIILGSHGRQGFEHFLFGSVAEDVLRKAPCSVEVVKRVVG